VRRPPASRGPNERVTMPRVGVENLVRVIA
jgi:hypothetical protein